MKYDYSFKNNIGEITNCDIYLSESDAPKPLVLLLHGFRAFKDWGFFPYWAEKISKNGFTVAAIDFSLNAVLDRDNSIFDMEKFARNTVTQEIVEAKMFLEKLHSEPETILSKKHVINWNNEIYLIGHSLGGAIAIMVADENPAVKKLITVNSIFDFDIYTERQKEDWIKNGIKQFVDSTTRQTFVLNVDFLLDRLTYISEKSVTSAVSRLQIPYLILHGDADATVPPQAATVLYNASKNKNLTKIKPIKGGSHTFGIKHPFEATNPILEEVVYLIINFLNENEK